MTMQLIGQSLLTNHADQTLTEVIHIVLHPAPSSYNLRRGTVHSPPASLDDSLQIGQMRGARETDKAAIIMAVSYVIELTSLIQAAKSLRLISNDCPIIS